MALPRTLVRLGASPPHLGEMVGLTQPTHREPQLGGLGLSPFFPKWIGAVQEPLGQGLLPPSRRCLSTYWGLVGIAMHHQRAHPLRQTPPTTFRHQVVRLLVQLRPRAAVPLPIRATDHQLDGLPIAKSHLNPAGIDQRVSGVAFRKRRSIGHGVDAGDDDTSRGDHQHQLPPLLFLQARLVASRSRGKTRLAGSVLL